MRFKSPSQPLCRNCGKPIAKVTDWVHPAGGLWQDTGLRNKADCQLQTNLKVLALRYRGREDLRWVWAYSVWDGETYEDEFFDKNECAIVFARACARHNNLALPPYNEAIRDLTMADLPIYNCRFTHGKLPRQTHLFVAAPTRKRAAELMGLDSRTLAEYGGTGAWTGLAQALRALPEVVLVDTGVAGRYVKLTDLDAANSLDDVKVLQLDYAAYMAEQHGEVIRHTAFGTVRASRVSGRRDLFQVDYPQDHYVILEISTASLRRNLSSDWVSSEKEVVEVAMSGVQWANLLSSMNAQPTPCTFQRYRDPVTGDFYAPKLEHHHAGTADTLRREVEARGLDAVAQVTAARAKLDAVLAQPSVRKADLREVLDLLSRAEQQAGSNLGFVVQRAQETITEAQQHAISEVDSHVDFAMMRLGERALGERLNQALEHGEDLKLVGSSIMRAIAPPEDVDAQAD